MMTTLIDNGLLENVEDPISLMEFDPPSVIDLDNMDVTIEDPGYILEDPEDTYSFIEIEDDEEEQCFSSYKKPSLMLPATFFDINSNIKLLKKCRPISIKIVDCDIYPWYYKEIKKFVNNNYIITNNEELSNQEMLNGTTDIIDLSYTCVEEEEEHVLNRSKINLSSQQTPGVLQLKQEVHARVAEVEKNVIVIVDEEINNLRSGGDNTQIIKTQSGQLSEIKKNESKDFDNGININDLLTCKAIAQTIVRKTDPIIVRNKTNDKNICISKPHNEKGNSDDLCNESLNNIMLINAKTTVKEKNIKNRKQKETGPNIITSPILPCKTKPQKKTKPKQNVPNKSKKINGILEKCHNSYTNCDKLLSSTNTLIPHYHCRMPVPTINSNNCYLSSLTANQMYSQEFIRRDAGLHWQQPMNNSDNSFDKTNLIPTYDYPGRQDAPASSFNEVSYSGCYNERPIEHQYGYPSSLCYQNYNLQPACNYSRQVSVNDRNNLHVIRRPNVVKASKQNCKPPNKNVYDYNMHNAVTTINKYAPYKRTQNRFMGALSNTVNVIQTNPSINQVLNCNNLSGYYQSALEKGAVVGPESTIGSNAQSILKNSHETALIPNPTNYKGQLGSTSFAQNNNSQYPHSQIYWDTISRTEDSNLFKNTTNSHFTHPANNTSVNNYQRFQNIPNDALKVPNAMPSKTGCVVGITPSYSEPQTVKRISSASCKASELKVLNQKDPKLNSQNTARNSVQLPRFEDIKVSKHTIDSFIDKSIDKKISKSDHVNIGKFSINSILNPSEKIAEKQTSNNCATLLPTKDTSLATSEHVNVKLYGYSPPILPIPSFKKGLEMSSAVPKHHFLNTTYSNYFQQDTYKNKCNIDKQYEYTNLMRKRKLDTEERMDMNNKRISLQEYQQRKMENGRTLTYVNISCRKENVGEK